MDITHLAALNGFARSAPSSLGLVDISSKRKTAAPNAESGGFRSGFLRTGRV